MLYVQKQGCSEAVLGHIESLRFFTTESWFARGGDTLTMIPAFRERERWVIGFNSTCGTKQDSASKQTKLCFISKYPPNGVSDSLTGYKLQTLLME